MGPLVQMPDLELWGTGWIRAALRGRDEPYAGDVYVDHRVPNPLRSRMAIVRCDGGRRVDMLHEQAVLAVNVYAPTEAEAGALASLLEGLLLGVRAVSPVEYTSSQSRPMRVPDTTPRRFFSVEMVVRGFDGGGIVPGFVFPVPGGGTVSIVDNGDGTFTITET